MHGTVNVPPARNEPVLSYAPGTPERAALEAELARQSGEVVDIPLIIGGKEIRTGNTVDVVVPHDHAHVIAKAHVAGEAEIKMAVDAAMTAHATWSKTPWEDRASIFLKAAALLSGPWRQVINAATMLNQSKTCHQAEIDAAAELVDFFQFNVQFASEIYGQQPVSDAGMWNRSQYRALEGFVYAVSPFNFTSIGGNLSGAPAMMGNTVLWKPSDKSLLSNYYVFRLMEEAGVPAGVINFVNGDPVAVTAQLLGHRDFGGVHFTGSTTVFKSFWKTIGQNMDSYRSYPRIVGETGGKDFIVAHPSADRKALTTAIVRGAFEFQGQKCSAASRAYIPQSVWTAIKDDLVAQTNGLTMGDVADFSNYMGAVIHQGSFDKIKGYIERAKASPDADVIAGGDCDDSKGWFVRPTIIVSKKGDYESLCEEIFGPVITIYVYPDADWTKTLKLVDETSPYALTGAVFSQDRAAVREAMDALEQSAGNFYINDKPTGAVVGQQPFGGARASGTNDKAGSPMNLLRWISARTIKETFVPATDYTYPFMGK